MTTKGIGELVWNLSIVSVLTLRVKARFAISYSGNCMENVTDPFPLGDQGGGILHDAIVKVDI